MAVPAEPLSSMHRGRDTSRLSKQCDEVAEKGGIMKRLTIEKPINESPLLHS